MSENEEADNSKARFRHLKVIFAHFREEWYKYVIQATVVISGIVIAFALEKWHLIQLEQEEFTDAYELIAQEISVDTTHISKIISRFEKRRTSYESILKDSMTREEFDACYYCPRMVTSLYTISPTDLGFEHLSKLADYRIGPADTLNHAIEEYYREVHVNLPMWQEFIRYDIQENIGHWKLNMSWYYKRERRPEEMIDYQLNSSEYKNMVYVQRNLIYKNYIPLLQKLDKHALDILKMIEFRIKGD